MARGKTRERITAAMRDRWIEDWEKSNSKGNRYASFIDPRDIRSNGSKGRVPDYENDGQDIRVLSNNERLFAYLLAFDNNILWVKAQYPLLPLSRSRAVAKHLGLRHPTYPSTNVHAVVTSDYYCGTLKGSEVVYSIKDDEQLKKQSKKKLQNTLNKEKIQQAFWNSKGVPFHLIHSSDYKNNPFPNNLRKLAKNTNLPLYLELIRSRWLKIFMTALPSFHASRLSSLIDETSTIMAISYEDGVQLLQHCLWNKMIVADLTVPLFYEQPVSVFKFRANIDD